jgi:hypothetical protein
MHLYRKWREEDFGMMSILIKSVESRGLMTDFPSQQGQTIIKYVHTKSPWVQSESKLNGKRNMSGCTTQL